MIYQHAAVLGQGQLAVECAVLLKAFIPSIMLFDTNPEPSSVLQLSTGNHKIDYRHLKKKDLMEHLAGLGTKTLLISAANRYIIPELVLSSSCITAINLHHSLLPRHPGRNAEAWAIFKQDSEAGITWHMITPEIDAGQILTQKKVLLDERTTSIQLLKKQHELAIQGFAEIIEDLVNGRLSIPLSVNATREQLHYSWEVPNGGVLSLDWDGAKISAFLRAMDYGVLEVLGRPSVSIDGIDYIWKKYIIESSEVSKNIEFVDLDHRSIIIQRENTKVTLINFSRKPTS